MTVSFDSNLHYATISTVSSQEHMTDPVRWIIYLRLLVSSVMILLPQHTAPTKTLPLNNLTGASIPYVPTLAHKK